MGSTMTGRVASEVLRSEAMKLQRRERMIDVGARRCRALLVAFALGLCAQTAAMAQASDDDDASVPRARADTCPQPDYPAESEAAGESGTVMLALRIGADGRVGEARVEESSGFARLDEAALAALRQCRFEPARANGKPVEAWSRLKYTYKIATPDSPDDRLLDAVTKITHLRKYIDGLGAQCQQVLPDEAQAFAQARHDWHATNDGLVAQAGTLKQGLYAKVRGESKGQSAASVISAMETRLQTRTDEAAAQGLAAIGKLSESEQVSSCEKSLRALAAGAFDIDSFMPEQYRLISDGIRQLEEDAKTTKRSSQ